MSTQDPPRKPFANVLVASLTGTSLEWYDFFLYSTAAALILGTVFFPSSDPAIGTLLSLATFGVGFIARPVGAAFFGVFGDRFGRKPTVMATLALMGLATAAIGVLPGYATLGLWAPVLLVVLRLLQGFAAGAQFAGSTVYAVEYAPSGRRGLFGGMSSSGLYVGVLLSSGIFALFQMLPAAQFQSWGWRVPFLLSLVLVAVTLVIRSHLDETPEFTQEVRGAGDAAAATGGGFRVVAPLLSTFRYQWRSVLIIICVVAAPFTATYAYQTYALSYLTDNLHVGGSIGSVSLTIASAVAIVVVPLAAALSDKIGRRPVLIIGSVFSALFAFPFFWLLATKTGVGITFAMIGGTGIGVPFILGAQGAMLSERFSAHNRFTGFGMGRELGSVLFAGLTPVISDVLVSAANGRSWPVSVYVILACVITIIVGFVIKETNPGRPVTERPAAAVAARG
jgi:MFS family permease